MALLLAIDADPDERASWRALLQAELPDERLLDAPTEDVDIAIVANPPAGALAGLPRLRLIQSLWAGVDRLLADPTVPVDVPLARMVDPAMNEAMAETALWAVLALHRGFFDYAAQQRAGEWRVHAQRRADEVLIAVLGLGQMGRTVALRLAANRYPVWGWSTHDAAVAGVRSTVGEAALPATLAAADIVVNLLPLTRATNGLFGARRLAQMKPGAALVNLARGAHVVDADLVDALDSGWLRHAVLDVFHTEPLPPEHPFWRHPRITLLPHVAAQTDPRSAARVAADNVRAVRAGRAALHLVNRARGY
ncbi:glyoxylate/hydroxypyruvate reductase A [Piscinibacter sp. XHJ-5]|uniref:2-hydroxyacid dehydrogenase n=1 Tax=Piscinibacter sp. XHJ-5 TaxID=3037797 RepID=UPI00245334C4|nr:glyoxylate/hydroxypyruvate reductase A [Piscinibacter sp. XHJ-5]